MKQSLQLRLGQQLAMTPQLQQAIRLLQLSSLDLQTEIREALESNPMLEVDDDPDTDARADDTPPVTASDGADSVPVDGTPEFGPETDFSSAWALNGHQVADDDEEAARDPYWRQGDGDDSLHDHLFEQLHLSRLSERDRLVGSAIIEGIRDDGYLAESIEDVQTGLAREGLDCAADEIETMLHLVQSFDPAGVAARDPGECMHLQLARLDEDTPGLADARRIIGEHIETLAAHDYRGLKRRLRIDDEALATAIELVQSLDPHPGSQLAASAARYIVPDVFVRRERGIWRVRLNPDIAPRLRIHPTYAGLVRRADQSADNTFMRNNLQEARWFIKSLQSRNETLLRVATAIVENQRAFLEHGDEAMKPMVLRDIAEHLEMHESTISRVTTEKYMHTPRGILEFKYFFSSHVGTAAGGECSATAIRAMIRKLIAEEEGSRPLSDHRIASHLVDQGINVARRTVAKYREAMAIPPSNERKRPG